MPGDTLFLFSDGITEAFDAQGTEFGTARLETALEAAAAAAPPSWSKACSTRPPPLPPAPSSRTTSPVWRWSSAASRRKLSGATRRRSAPRLVHPQNVAVARAAVLDDRPSARRIRWMPSPPSWPFSRGSDKSGGGAPVGSNGRPLSMISAATIVGVDFEPHRDAMRRRRARQPMVDHVRDRFFERQRQLHRDIPGDPRRRAARLDPFDQTRDLGKKRLEPEFVRFHVASYASS